MKYLYVEPEAPGGLGPRTEFDGPPEAGRVTRLHLVFDGWLGDELVESTPCFAVTKPLGETLKRSGLTGYELRPVEVEYSRIFAELYPGRPMPRFEWLTVHGVRGTDDFLIASDRRLVLSERAWQLIRPRAPNAVVSPFDQE